MIVFRREAEQKISVGENVVITVCKIHGNAVRIGIDAPSSIHVRRHEEAPKAGRNLRLVGSFLDKAVGLDDRVILAEPSV